MAVAKLRLRLLPAGSAQTQELRPGAGNSPDPPRPVSAPAGNKSGSAFGGKKEEFPPGKPKGCHSWMIYLCLGTLDGTEPQGRVSVREQGHGFGDQGHGFGGQGHRFGGQGRGFGDQGHGFGGQRHGFGNDPLLQSHSAARVALPGSVGPQHPHGKPSGICARGEEGMLLSQRSAARNVPFLGIFWPGLALPFRAASQNLSGQQPPRAAAGTKGILPLAAGGCWTLRRRCRSKTAAAALPSPPLRPPALIKLICIAPNDVWREETQQRARGSSPLPLGSLPAPGHGEEGAGSCCFPQGEDVRKIRRRNQAGQRRRSWPAGRQTGVERADAGFQCHLGAGSSGSSRTN